jgi:hypothetical protein
MRGAGAIADARCRRYARALAAITALFTVHVAAQALRHWNGGDALAPPHGLIGSALPYWLLLAVQVFLLALMSAITYDVAGCTRRRNARAARVLGWLGGMYFAGSLGRIAAGLTLANAPPWFTAWSAALFHLVLAAFVVTLAAYHATEWRGSEALQAG